MKRLANDGTWFGVVFSPHVTPPSKKTYVSLIHHSTCLPQMHPSCLFLSCVPSCKRRPPNCFCICFAKGPRSWKVSPKKNLSTWKKKTCDTYVLSTAFIKNVSGRFVTESLHQNQTPLCGILLKRRFKCTISPNGNFLFKILPTYPPPQAHGSNTSNLFPTCSKGISFIWCLARYVGSDFDSIFYTSISSSPIFKFQVILNGFLRFTTKVAGNSSKLQHQDTLTLSAGRHNL